METGDDEDQISNLPDSLLIHILSFLETIYAVRCSILSTRWRNLWASVPNLTFHSNRHYSNEFFNFIDRVLLLHDLLQIRSFTLTGIYTYHIDANRFNNWICAVIKRRVQDLHLVFSDSFHLHYSSNFPLSLFTCKTLVNLTLGFNNCIFSKLPNSIYLPNLKSLKIGVSIITSDCLLQKLFSSCPVLEVLYLGVRLRLERQGVEKKVTINICKQSLRVLRLYLEELSYGDRRRLNHEVVIDAPALDDLLLDDNFMGCYSIKNVSSSSSSSFALAKVHLNVGLDFHPKLVERDCRKLFLELLGGISNVKSLYLSRHNFHVLGFAEDNAAQSTLGNLTRLELGVNRLSKLLQDLLAKMPNLESLKLIMEHQLDYYDNYEEVEFYRIQWHVVPCCLLSHLKVIEGDNFEGMENDLLLVEYFLNNAKVLNKMSIKHRKSVSVNVEVLKRILMFSRGSETCDIEIEDLIANPNMLEATPKYWHGTNRKSLVEFEVNDFVWAVLAKDRFSTSEYKKLATRKIGPLEIVVKINSHVYRLKLPSNLRRVPY